MKSRHKSLWNQRKQNRVFRSLLEYDLGVTVDNDWNLVSIDTGRGLGRDVQRPIEEQVKPERE